MKKMIISFLSVMSMAAAGCGGMRDNLAGSMESVGMVEMLQAEEGRVVQAVAETDQRSVETAETGTMENAPNELSAGMPEDIAEADPDIQPMESADTEPQETAPKEDPKPETSAETLEVAETAHVPDSTPETDNAPETESITGAGGTMETEPKEQVEAAPEGTEDVLAGGQESDPAEMNAPADDQESEPIETAKEPERQVIEPVAVSYSPDNIVSLVIEKCLAGGMKTTELNLADLLAEGRITKEEYDEYYPLDGLEDSYYSVFVNVDLNRAATTSGRLLESEEGIAEYIAGMLLLERGPIFNIRCTGTFEAGQDTFYEFRCYR